MDSTAMIARISLVSLILMTSPCAWAGPWERTRLRRPESAKTVGNSDSLCGRTTGLWVYQVSVADLEQAKRRVMEVLAAIRSVRLKKECRGFAGWTEVVRPDSPMEWKHVETRWIPRRNASNLERAVLAMGKLQMSDEFGILEGAEKESPLLEFERLQSELRTHPEKYTDPIEQRIITDRIRELEPGANAVRQTSDMDLIQIVLVQSENDLSPYMPPPSVQFDVVPTTRMLEPSTLGADELRRTMEWFNKNKD